ncbi:RDD family protein [uncultured Winogradskyella sp.]|uniref:RDD family protein n=1 Tax=uncultured Winogradskyella sp. TaxID=395353 RepID=UPI00261C896E|nr:RDD family protein [uncultured Winogradskyella sp.]
MNNNYARLQSRIKAAVIDGIILMALMYCTSELLNSIENVNPSVRMYLFILYVVLYEPLLVSVFGSTLCHYYSDIKVRQEKNNSKKMSFPLAFVRFIIKSLLGWLSLLTITGSEKHQAIHDSIVKSFVLID